MYSLGIYTYHTATACLLQDGEVLGIISEERFNRIKNYAGFPKEAVAFLLKEHHLTPAQIDYVALSHRYGDLTYFKSLRQSSGRVETENRVVRVIGKMRGAISSFVFLPMVKPVYVFFYFWAHRFVGTHCLREEIFLLAEMLAVPASKFRSEGHHLSHAASSYYTSGYHNEKSLVLVSDGGGDGLCDLVAIASGSEWKILSQTPAFHSTALIYHDMTAYLGMKPLEHEQKVMGLAPYASEALGQSAYRLMADWITLDKKNRLQLASKFDTHYAYRYIEKAMKGMRFDAVAFAVQRLIEERMVEWVQESIKQTGVKTICLAGGLFMNVKLNMRIAALPEVDKLYVVPSCGDESTPIGACYLAYRDWYAKSGKEMVVTPFPPLYLGPNYSREEVLAILKTTTFHYEYIENVEQKIAELLAQGKVVAVMRGRMEFGARALGNRSILADPSRPHLVKEINDQVKKRDFWMPFAPTILQERSDDYIVNPKHIPSPHMMIAFHTTPLAQAHFAAAVHPYDLTMRPQILEEKENPSYYRLIKAFEKLTGIGGVLNTSFNLHGLPIVLGPEQALADFENSHLQYLVLEDYLVTKVR